MGSNEPLVKIVIQYLLFSSTAKLGFLICHVNGSTVYEDLNSSATNIYSMYNASKRITPTVEYCH
jgi:hypothetical protein